MIRFFSVLFFFLFIIISCDNGNDNTETECSYQNPKGSCEDGKTCVEGICLYTCNQEKECPESYKCSENICYDTTKNCSKSNPFGKCDENETCIDGVCKNLLPCSESNPKGICSSENRVCYNGICVEKTEECRPWNINGVCPEDYYCDRGYCKHEKVYPPCSPAYPEGKCPLNEDVCINGLCISEEGACGTTSTALNCPNGQQCVEGQCKTDVSFPCSDENPFGYCEDGSFCYLGVCYDINEPCSENNPIGKCPDKEICNYGICKIIFDECNDEKPCPDIQRQYCDNHVCKDKEIFCSEQNVKGLCPEGKTCVNGECLEITEECSLSNLEGKCDSLNLKCINGECFDSSQEGVCSQFNPSGKCPENSVCNNGICEGNIKKHDIGHSCIVDEECKDGLFCEKTFLDGYCTKECDDNTDCTDDSECYKLSSQKGYCLSKCSVNIPNSCARDGFEDYVCYPVSGNEGVCLYDCKYNDCFDTQKTCDAVKGYCK